MTTCPAVRDNLSAWIDAELTPSEQADVAAHLEQCAGCWADLRQLEQLNGDLSAWGLAGKSAAEQLAAQVLIERPNSSVPDRELVRMRSAAEGASTNRQSSLLAISGTLVALLLMLALVVRTHQSEFSPAESRPTSAPVARITAATGPVSFKSPEQEEWQFVSVVESFSCPAGTSISTGDQSLCELETESGSIIRLNRSSTVTIDSSAAIRFQQGEIYCAAGRQSALQVQAGQTSKPNAQNPVQNAATPTATALPVFTCPADSSCSIMTAPPIDETRVTCSSGQVQVDSLSGTTQLTSGTEAVLHDGGMQKELSGDLLLSTDWLIPLLVNGNRHQAEINQRVEALLAQLGQTKLSALYEQQILALGEPGAWPLLAFLKAPDRGTDAQRQRAAHVVAQSASPAMTEALLALLRDDDPTVRTAIAKALQRITGLHQDAPAQLWMMEDSAQSQAVEADWRAWWAAYSRSGDSPGTE